MPYSHPRTCLDCGNTATVRSSTKAPTWDRCHPCAAKQRERIRKIGDYMTLIGEVGQLVTRLRRAIDSPMVDAQTHVRMALTKLEDDYADWADALTLERMTARLSRRSRLKEKAS